MRWVGGRDGISDKGGGVVVQALGGWGQSDSQTKASICTTDYAVVSTGGFTSTT